MKKVKSYVISVSSGSGCYRHIQISGSATLAQLSEAILDAFDFMNDHAHAFFMDNRAWSDADSYYMDLLDDDEEEGLRHTCDVMLDQLSLMVERKFLYLFDFGDEWRFSCKVLKVLDVPTQEPEIVRAKGEPPSQYGMEDEDEMDLDDEMEDEEE